MNKTLFMGSLRANYVMILGFTGFTLIYVVVSVVMFKPGSAELIEAMLTMLPVGMIKAFGFDQLTGELTTYLGSYLFGFILLVFPMICSILLANNLVCKMVDKGSMAYLLTSTNTRVKVIITQYVFLVTGIAWIFVVDFIVAVILAELVFPGMLVIRQYFMLNLVTTMVSLAVASIAFLLSCVFNESRMTMSFGGAVGGVFVICHMLAGLNDKIAFMKYFSLYSFVDVNRSLNDAGYAFLVSCLMLGICVVLLGLSLWIFNKRSLAI